MTLPGSHRSYRGPARSNALSRALGALLLAGATIGVLVLALLPVPHQTDLGETYALMGACLVLGTMLLCGGDRLPSWVVQGVLALSTLVVSTDILFSRGHTIGDEMFYLWPALCAFYFCTRAQAAGHLAVIGVSYALALAIGGGPQLVTHWTLVFGSLLGMWLVVDRLVTRLEENEEEARRHAEELATAERHFRSAFDDAATGMTLTDPDGAWIRVNRAFAEFLGYEEADLVGRFPWEFTHPSDRNRTRTNFGTARSGELDRWTEEKRYLRRDGSVAWGHLSVSMVRDKGEAAYAIAQIQDITDRKHAEAELAHQAVHDPLTGLPNRLLFLDRLTQSLHRLGRSRGSVAVLFCDLDRFKLVNDSFGHDSGDDVIVLAAERLKAVLRPSDTLSRFGGDEFTILCEASGPEGAVAVAERVADAFAAPFEVGGRPVFISTSIGIAHTESPDASTRQLLAEADAAMYRAKESGRARFAVFDPAMRLHGAERLEVESELRRALETNELVVHYQPQIELATGRIVQLEALVRWQHPERGLLAPAEFIAVAEDSRLIIPLGAQVLEKACHQAHAWRAAGHDVRMGVNLSPRQLADADIVGVVSRALTASGLEPGALCLEITENAVIDDLQAGLATLEALKGLGVSLAIDDFGAGFSSLNQVRRLSPVDVLKIDRSFISRLDTDTQEAALVAAVVGMAQALELCTVAEGIETEEQARILRELGCELGQGYFFARPAPAEAIERRLVLDASDELVA